MRRFEPLWVLPAAKLVLHLATFRGYGLFRDEFYYVACSERLAFGYVDQPPFSLAMLAGVRAVFGDSTFAIRLLPAILGALCVLIVGLVARRLGGGRYAQSLAMTAFGLSYLYVFHVYSMNGFDVLAWVSVAYVMIRIAQDGSPWWWIALGMVLGLGLENKISVLWLGFGLAVGLVATQERRWLTTPWPWVAATLAAVLFLPHVLWQIAHGWPTLEFIKNATGEKMIDVMPLDFLRGQLTMLNPAVTLLWISGLGFLLFHRAGRPYRLLGWVYLAVFALLMASGSSRAGYLGPAYTWLLAAGAVTWERWMASPGRRWARGPVLVLVMLACVVRAPFSLPVLPVERYVAYAEALGVAPSTEERKALAELPQRYADMFGWRELVDAVTAVYETLPPADRERVAIFTANYGNSGAIDYLGTPRGLPPSLSGHNNYWLWGPRGYTGEVMIVVGASREQLSRLFANVERAGTVTCRYCMPYENDKPIWIARGIRRPLAELWPELKHYD